MKRRAKHYKQIYGSITEKINPSNQLSPKLDFADFFPSKQYIEWLIGHRNKKTTSNGMKQKRNS